MKKSIFLTLAFSAYTSVALAGNLETTTTYLFEFDSVKINAASQQQLNNINNESNITKITIDGYSDKLGPVVKNQKLAQDRAENVKNGLLAKNIDPKLVTVAWHGSQNSLASERCFSELGKDNYWAIERLKKDLAKNNANVQLQDKWKHELSEREAKQDKLAECTAPDRRVIVVVTSLAVMAPAVATVVPVVAVAPIKALVTNTSVESQEEYPLQDNIKIKYESSTCSLNRSNVAGIRVWQAKVSDGNLHNVLSRWANQAGWVVKWNSTYNFPIEYPWTIKATFDCAVNELLRNTQDTQLPLVGQMYLGNKILLIIDGK